MAGLNLFTNNAATTLATGINSSVTSLTVASATGALFPTLAGLQYFYCTLSNAAGTTIEIVKVTARSTDTFTIVRGQDNTTAAAFIAGDKVELRLTAADLQNFPQLDSTNTFSQTQTFVTPILGTPTSGTLTNCTGYTTANLSGSIGLTTQVTGTLPATNGGTGQSSYAVGDLLFASTTTALSKLADVATGNALISGGVGVAPSYGKIGLTTHVSGTLPVTNGGTGVATLTTAYGILAAGTTATGAIQNTGAGTAGQVLTSNGASALPTFQTPSGGGVTSLNGQTGAIDNTTQYAIGSYIIGRPNNATTTYNNTTIAGSSLYAVSVSVTAYNYNAENSAQGYTIANSFVNTGSWRCVSISAGQAIGPGSQNLAYAGLWVRYA
jgi:hypothetical protein